MARTRIGVTCSAGDGTTMRIEKVGRLYLDGIVDAGGLPVVLPTLDAALAAEALVGIGGLVLTSGDDVDPARYGADREPETGPADDARDAWDLALVQAARAAGLPILAICRGIQVLAVACGGTLVQHLPHRTDTPHDDLPGVRREVHRVDLVAGSRLAGILGADEVGANSIHHQGVDAPGAGLVVVGRTADGVVEAIESPTEPLIGVQWHPELLLDRPAHRALFEWVVAEAARR